MGFSFSPLSLQPIWKVPPFTNTTIENVSSEYGSLFGVKSISQNDNEYLLFSFSEPNNLHTNKGYLGLFNRSEHKWVYTKKLLHEKRSARLLTIVGDKVYFILGDAIECRNLWTGDSIWNKEFNGNFVFGEYMIDNGTLYAAAEGDGYYALNAETGAIKWKGERAPGTSSRMVILNGVLYYVNGGDGRLWALDAETGKTLWRLKSPDNNFGFKSEINVMPGDGTRKGYVLTSTWHGACAYEAER